MQGVDEGIVKGLYKFSDAKSADHKARLSDVVFCAASQQSSGNQVLDQFVGQQRGQGSYTKRQLSGGMSHTSDEHDS